MERQWMNLEGWKEKMFSSPTGAIPHGGHREGGGRTAGPYRPHLSSCSRGRSLQPRGDCLQQKLSQGRMVTWWEVRLTPSNFLTGSPAHLAGLTAPGGGWAGLLLVGSSSQGLNCPCRGWTGKHGGQWKAVVRFTAGQAASVQL